MQTIYIDVLMVLNIYVNYFLLKATAKITHTMLKSFRCIIASVYGSFFSLTILLPQLSTIFSIIIKVSAAITIVMMAFGMNGKKRLLINIIAFFTVNFLFAGIIYAVYSWLKPDFMHLNNTYFYIDFSMVVLVCTTAIIYFSLCAIRIFFDKSEESSGSYRITIKYRDKMVSLIGLADTGNLLVDFFSGNPVIICGSDIIPNITGLTVFTGTDGKIPKGFRLIPYSTISGGSVVPIFRPDEIIISDCRSGLIKKVDAMVGFAPKSKEAVFNPKLLKI